MKRINDLLPKAMSVLRSSNLLLEDGKSMLKEYDGYVAAFAPSVITAGLKATLSFYTDVHKDRSDGVTRRNHVLKVMFDIYNTIDNHLTGSSLLDIALNEQYDNTKQRALKKDLIDISIALKLVMRNFEQVDKKPEPLPNNPTDTQP